MVYVAHGLRHLDLTRASDTELREETRGAKELIESTFQAAATASPSPRGRPRLAAPAADPLLLPRVGWGRHASTLKLIRWHFLP